MVGYTFEIGSTKQLGIALFEKMGIPSPGMTRGKNPQHRTDADVLEKLAKTHPVIEFVITYRKVSKAKGSYFAKLKRLASLKIPVRFSFNMFAAPTYRFAAPGGDPIKDGFCGVNIQAVSNGEARDMFAVDLTQTGSSDEYTRELDDDELFFTKELAQHEVPTTRWGGQLEDLPWTVWGEEETPKLYCFRETCKGCPAACAAKGIDTTRRFYTGLQVIPSVKQAFKAPEGYTILTFDYSKQELVIAANMSGEPKWIAALSGGADVHAVTAAQAFGYSTDDFAKLEKQSPAEFERKRGIG